MIKRPSVENALHNLRPNAHWSVVYGSDDSYEVRWQDEDQSEPSAKEIAAEIDRLAEAWSAEEYRVLRRPLYPKIEDQLDDLFHAGAFSPEMTAQIQAVKDAHPKPKKTRRKRKGE